MRLDVGWMEDQSLLDKIPNNLTAYGHVLPLSRRYPLSLLITFMENFRFESYACFEEKESSN